MKVIGVVGLNGSGKDEMVKYLNQKYSVPLISVGDIVRELAAEQGGESTRDNLDALSATCFKKYGEGYFVKQVVAKIRRNRWPAAGISGIRSPVDIEIVRQAFGRNFVLINVYVSDSRVRYQRVHNRGSRRDQITFEDFLRQDEESENLFRIRESAGLADYSIDNDGTLEQMHSEIEKLVKKGLLD
ncbi:MAG TPA: AAA family ATPase [Dehalococcoidales bacterium]